MPTKGDWVSCQETSQEGEARQITRRQRPARPTRLARSAGARGDLESGAGVTGGWGWSRGRYAVSEVTSVAHTGGISLASSDGGDCLVPEDG